MAKKDPSNQAVLKYKMLTAREGVTQTTPGRISTTQPVDFRWDCVFISIDATDSDHQQSQLGSTEQSVTVQMVSPAKSWTFWSCLSLRSVLQGDKMKTEIRDVLKENPLCLLFATEMFRNLLCLCFDITLNYFFFIYFLVWILLWGIVPTTVVFFSPKLCPVSEIYQGWKHLTGDGQK